jgi:hypothetical protein
MEPTQIDISDNSLPSAIPQVNDIAEFAPVTPFKQLTETGLARPEERSMESILDKIAARQTIQTPVVELSGNEQININWTKLALGYEWEGWDTNQNLVDYTHQIVYFYNQKLQVIKKFNPVNNKEEVINATDWPSKAAQLVLDIKGNRIIGWPAIKDDGYACDQNSNTCILLFSGVHYVTACGASFGWDATNAVPFQFGGYGYFKYKNWYWEFKESSKEMLDLYPNIVTAFFSEQLANLTSLILSV